MPRTTESIIANHHAATERRTTGKPIWDRRIRGFKTILLDEETTFEQQRDRLVACIQASSWFGRGSNKQDLLDAVGELSDTEDIEHFDAVLDAIYDMADADRVWLGE